jgi:hypothetical protein
LNYNPHFPHEKISWVKEEFWNMSFENQKFYGLNIPHQMHLKANVNKHKFIIIQVIFMKKLGTKL